jgi:hypothetical protein
MFGSKCMDAHVSEHGLMSRDPNDDISRAMATVSASAMPYRHFEDLPPRAGDVPLMGRPDLGDIGQGPPNRPVRDPIDFPLLVAAFPEIRHVAVPHGLAAERAGNDSPEHHFVLSVQPNTHRQTETLDKIPVPVRPMLAPRRRLVPDQPATGAAADGRARTSLGSVFRGLLGTRPSEEKRPAVPSGLQDVFGSL